MAKYTILSWLSILMSFLSLVLYLWKHLTILIELNVIFTGTCLILMHIKYQSKYEFLCRGFILCVRCCEQKSCKCDEVVQLELTALGNESTISNTDRFSTTKKNTVDIPHHQPLPSVDERGSHDTTPSLAESGDGGNDVF